MSFKEIPPPDASILERICETEVEQWFVAKLHQMRGVAPEVFQINLTAWKLPNRNPYVNWGGHANPELCEVSSDSTADVLSGLMRQANEPMLKKATEAREEAARLLRIAEEMEAIIKP